MRWSNYEYRRPDPDLPPETTYMQGAPGNRLYPAALAPPPGRGPLGNTLAARPSLV